MSFLTVMEAANAIAAQLRSDEAPRAGYSIHNPIDLGAKNAGERLADEYWHHIQNGLHDGTLIGRHQVSRFPIVPPHAGNIFAFSACVVSQNDLNKWLTELGVGVQIDDAPGGCIGRNPVRTTESREARRDRLSARKRDLIASGIRNFNQQLAREEGVTVARIQQDLRVKEAGAPSGFAWSSSAPGRSGPRSS